MRIGIVCYPTYGGSGVVATELGAALAERGHKVHIVSTSTPFRLATLELNDNVYFHEVPTVDYPLFQSELHTLSLAAKLRQVAEDEKLDLIHAHYAIPHAASAWLTSQMMAREGRRLPVIATLHGTDITLAGRTPSFHSIVQFVLREVEAVTAVSHWLAAETHTHFDPRRPVDVIHNSICPTRFAPKKCERCISRYAPNGEKVVVHMSNFRPVKRVLDVVRTFALIAKEIPARLLFVGDGPDREIALKEARDLGVLDRTWFLGKQDRIERFLGIADLFLFPSEHESFGLAALEAMSCEVPVVASNGGGLPEVITHGVTGFTFPVGDVTSMAMAGLSILKDEAFARRIGKAARQRVIDHFHPNAIVPQYEALYERVLNASNPSGTSAQFALRS